MAQSPPEEQALVYPHVVALWTLVRVNPVEQLRELRQLLRELWGRESGLPPTVADIPAHLTKYITQAVSFRTLRSVYGDAMVKQMESGAIPLPQDMTIPDAIIVGKVRKAFDDDEFKDHLVLKKGPSQVRHLLRPTDWQEGQSVSDAEHSFMKAVDSLKGEFRALSDRQAYAAGKETSLITYCHLPMTAEPFSSGRPGFQVRMEFRQVTRLGKVLAKDITEYEVVSEVGEFPVSAPNRITLSSMMKDAADFKPHNPFRDAEGRHIIKGAKTERRGPFLLDVSKDS